MTLTELIKQKHALEAKLKRNVPDGWTHQQARKQLTVVQAELDAIEHDAELGRAVEAMPVNRRITHFAMRQSFVMQEWDGGDWIAYAHGATAREALGLEVKP